MVHRFHPRKWFRSPLWRHQAFRRYWTGEAISMVGSSISDFALPIVAVVTFHVSAGQMGFIRALGSAPGILIGLLAGVWVDRMNRQRLLLGLNVAAGLLVASIPLAYALGSLSLGHLYAVAVAFGLLFPFWSPAWNAFLPAVVPPELLVDANSKMVLSFAASGITGPAIGGALVAIVSAPYALLVDAGSFVVSCFFLAGVRPMTTPTSAGDRQPIIRELIEGLRLTFLNPMQRAVTIPRAILDLMDAVTGTVLVLFVLRQVGLSAGLLGLALAMGSVGFVVGSALAPRMERRLGIGALILLGLGLVGASPYSMLVANDRLPTAVNVLCFVLPGLIGGFGGIIQFIGLQALRQSITPERLLGRVYASASVLGGVLRVMGALIGGFVGERIGLRAAIAVAAIGYGLPFLYALFSPLPRATRIAGPGSQP